MSAIDTVAYKHATMSIDVLKAYQHQSASTILAHVISHTVHLVSSPLTIRVRCFIHRWSAPVDQNILIRIFWCTGALHRWIKQRRVTLRDTENDNDNKKSSYSTETTVLLNYVDEQMSSTSWNVTLWVLCVCDANGSSRKELAERRMYGSTVEWQWRSEVINKLCGRIAGDSIISCAWMQLAEWFQLQHQQHINY